MRMKIVKDEIYALVVHGSYSK